MNKKTMQAAVAKAPGGPEVLQLEEVERPTPGLTEILVRVHAAGVNPTDWKSRAEGRDYGYPAILGYDVAGVIEEVGVGVTWLRVGDEVLGMPMFPHLPGAYAEYVVAPSRQFVRKPKTLTFEQAAGLPLAALTAWQGLVETGGLQPGHRVLIHAAAGGVGHLAVQIAKALGAYVIGTASAPKHEFVRALGADEVIDYRTEDFTAVLADQPVDVVFDPIAGETGLRSLKILKDGGSFVSILPVAPEAVAEADRRGIQAEFTLVEPDRLALTAITDLVEEGKLRLEIDSVFPLAEAADAHRRGETNKASGKIVIKVL
ncbi:NADP-dependent oxidoreductase [Kribbella antibiotica]|uniref:NADP-dependent oxidoreductase n=1 Tax=Kribbella antibiotica TaxID=190195 RepID=A0A4R4ZWJ4_9ACTN|nr:NADP-dependent oxidoreductase [Kribbella antibiotica]TDD62634.1 NADP-dependent oxidoreductase [Kribbella antibiotica]